MAGSTTQAKEPVQGLRLVIILTSMYFGIFLGALDGTVVASLLSHIASDLKELGRVAWIATGYLVACAAFQPLYGKISDIYGRKAMLLFCNAVFGLGCAMCGVAPNLEWLVAGRVISGIGGGGIMSVGTIAMNDLVPLRKRGIFQGIGNVCFGAGAGIGGVFGGWISNNHGWRMAFLVQVPLAVLSFVLLLVCFKTPDEMDSNNAGETSPLLDSSQENGSNANVKDKAKATWKRIDFYGAFLLVTMLILLMFAISTGGRQIPWTHPAIPTLLGASAVICAGFVYVEANVANEPVIPVRLLTHSTVLCSSLTNFFATMGVYTVLFFVPILFASVNNMDSTQVGTRLAGNFIGVASGSFFAGYYMKHTGKYYTLAVVSPLLLLAGISMELRFDQHTHMLVQMGALAFNGFGYSSMLTVTLIALIAAVSHKHQAVTTSIQYAFRGVGSTLGVSIASAIFQNVLQARLEHAVHGPGSHDAIKRVLDSVEEIRKVPVQFQPAIVQCYLGASRAVLVYAFAMTVLGALSSLGMHEHKLHDTLEREPEQQQHHHHHQES